MLRRSVRLCLLTALATLTAVFAPAQQLFNRHHVVLDAQGKLLSWSQHTSRYASVNALWYEITGDVAAKEKAFRSFNWATYMCHENGAVNNLAVEGQTIWFSDGYGDYIRHFMAGLGSVPKWAPPRENHLLRSSSIVQSVSYLPEEVNYKTFDATASQVLRLDFTRRRVLADGQELPKRADRGEVGWTFDPQHGVLQVRYENSHLIHVLGH